MGCGAWQGAPCAVAWGRGRLLPERGGHRGRLDVNHPGVHDLTLDLHHLLIVPWGPPARHGLCEERAKGRSGRQWGRPAGSGTSTLPCLRRLSEHFLVWLRKGLTVAGPPILPSDYSVLKAQACPLTFLPLGSKPLLHHRIPWRPLLDLCENSLPPQLQFQNPLQSQREDYHWGPWLASPATSWAWTSCCG